jgi:hypothetical protein
MNLDQLIGAAYVTHDFTALSDCTLLDCICRIETLGKNMPDDMLANFEAEADKRGLRSELDFSDLESELPAAATPMITRTAKKLTVTLANGDTASRGTSNAYTSVVVGYDATGKLSVLSAHWLPAEALKAVTAHKAGQFVNQNYRGKLVGAPIIVNA